MERQKKGLPAITENWELSRVARDKSMDMAQKNTLVLQVQHTDRHLI